MFGDANERKTVKNTWSLGALIEKITRKEEEKEEAERNRKPGSNKPKGDPTKNRIKDGWP